MCLSQIQHISQYFTIFHKFHNISQFHNYPKYKHLQCEDTSSRALIRTASSNPQCALAKGHAKFSTSQTTKQKIKVEEKVILKAKNTNTQIMWPKILKRFEQRTFPLLSPQMEFHWSWVTLRVCFFFLIAGTPSFVPQKCFPLLLLLWLWTGTTWNGPNLVAIKNIHGALGWLSNLI